MKTSKVPIAVFTSNRADYGLLKGLIRLIHLDSELDLQLWVGGSHLNPAAGMTLSEIEADGFPITECLDFALASNTAYAATKSLALATMAVGEALVRHRPNWLILLGDRYELLAVAQAALLANVPIAHIHGGERSEGVIDEAVRHAVTKMAYLHFTATEVYRKRVIQLGEQPERVFNVGAPGLDQLSAVEAIALQDLEAHFGAAVAMPFVLATFHPEASAADSEQFLKNLIRVLSHRSDLSVVFTRTNTDPGSDVLKRIIEDFCSSYPGRALMLQTSHQRDYLSLMQHCVAVVGNSSSGLIEAPSFGKPTLNIGRRQQGRLMGETVVQADGSIESIEAGLEEVLSPAFGELCQQAVNPYGESGASKRIFEYLKKYSRKRATIKTFYDLN